MSKKRYACHLHHETLDFFRNIRKVEGVIRPRTTWSKDLDKNHTKSITCYRSGITFKKDFSWYNGKFYKAYYDLERWIEVFDEVGLGDFFFRFPIGR